MRTLRRLLPVVSLALVGLAVLAGVVLFAREALAGVEEIRSELSAIEDDLRDQRQAREKVRRQELGILGELQLLQQRAEKGRANQRRLLKAQGTTAEAVAYTQMEIDRLERQADERRDLLGRRLSMLYMIGRDGGSRFVFSARDFSAMARRFLFLKAFAQQDRTIYDEILASVHQQELKKADLEVAMTTLDRLAELAKEELALYESDLAEKQTLLEQVQRERSVYEAVIQEKEKAASRLQSKLDQIIAADASERAGHEMSVADIPDSDVYTAEIPELRIWPTEGTIIRYFGRVEDPRYGTTTKSDGIDIAAPEGRYFVSVLPGEVIYADWFQGYGKLLVIAHADGVHTLYAHAQELLVRVGDHVDENQRIGTVGSTGSITEPALHFEIRKAGRAVDPLAYLAE
ncbi:MAG: peptidoglycan DD-metalloendopeptidase family protein [bacterium]|nr:peptidoglycan DD-metalloendopeptidase family protein [bacterium]